MHRSLDCHYARTASTRERELAACLRTFCYNYITSTCFVWRRCVSCVCVPQPRDCVNRSTCVEELSPHTIPNRRRTDSQINASHTHIRIHVLINQAAGTTIASVGRNCIADSKEAYTETTQNMGEHSQHQKRNRRVFGRHFSAP